MIHIGYHKTGSTWLQRVLFVDADNNFRLLGSEAYEARKKIVWPSSLEYEAKSVHGYYEPLISDAVGHGQVPVFSDERLSGNPFSGGFDSKELADRLARTFPNARILVVVREQADMIQSTYDEYVREGGACSLTDFLQPKTRYCTPMFRLGHFNYDRLVHYYMTTFGTDSVLVLPFELLRDDASRFVRSIVDFAGGRATAVPDARTKVNRSHPAALLSVQRRLNPFLVRDDLNANSIFAIPHGRYYLLPVLEAVTRLVPRSWNERLLAKRNRIIRAHVEGRYVESNQRLATLTGLDLGQFGYQT